MENGFSPIVRGSTGTFVVEPPMTDPALFVLEEPVPTYHADLLGLSEGDDHPQYALISGERVISGAWTFSPGSAAPPFALGTNALGQLVVGLNADKLDGVEAVDLKGPVYATSTVTSNTSVPASSRGVLYNCNTAGGAQTHTLPALADVPDGWSVGFRVAGSNTVTVNDSTSSPVTDGALSGLKVVRWFTKVNGAWSVSAEVAGTIAHSSLSGLSSDDHTQYVANATARTITAQHSFSPATAVPPFVLGSNAQGQKVTGLNADLVDGLEGTPLIGPLAGVSPAAGGTSVNVGQSFHGKLIPVTMGGQDCTINLADPAAFPENWCVGIQKVDAGNTITLVPAGGVTVDQSTITEAGETVWLYRKSATAYGILNKFYAGVSLAAMVSALEFSGDPLTLKATPRSALVVGSNGSPATVTNGTGVLE